MSAGAVVADSEKFGDSLASLASKRIAQQRAEDFPALAKVEILSHNAEKTNFAPFWQFRFNFQTSYQKLKFACSEYLHLRPCEPQESSSQRDYRFELEQKRKTRAQSEYCIHNRFI